MHVINLNCIHLNLYFSPIKELNDCLILSGEWEILLLQHFFIRMTLNLSLLLFFNSMIFALGVFANIIFKN